jgi:hypothetical protein
MDPITVRGTLIKLAKPDRVLHRLGRPWRFLSPWPEPKDRERELYIIDSTLEEIKQTKSLASAGMAILLQTFRSLALLFPFVYRFLRSHFGQSKD